MNWTAEELASLIAQAAAAVDAMEKAWKEKQG